MVVGTKVLAAASNRCAALEYIAVMREVRGLRAVGFDPVLLAYLV